MKFRKDIYKRAIGKIEKKQTEEENLCINQKYKQRILNNELDDSMEGFNATDYVYDIDMLKNGTVRRIIVRGILLFAGIILTILAFYFTYDNIKTRISGQKIRLEYTEKSKYLKHTNEKSAGYKYDGYMVEVKDETKNNSREKDKLELEYNGRLTRYVNVAALFYRNADVTQINAKDLVINSNNESDKEPVRVILTVYNNLPFICDYSPEKYVNIYYNPDKGEDYRKARVLYSVWLYVVMDVLVILYMVFATRLFIKEIKYEQSLRKREQLK